MLTWMTRGNALKALGRTTEAEVDFTKAKELGYTS
jgi:Flp pilus assembly protein TadD